MTLVFPKRGTRRNAGTGLTYRAADGPFSIFKGDQVGGVRLKTVMWSAIEITTNGERLLSRHRTRESAENACQERHDRNQQ